MSCSTGRLCFAANLSTRMFSGRYEARQPLQQSAPLFGQGQHARVAFQLCLVHAAGVCVFCEASQTVLFEGQLGEVGFQALVVVIRRSTPATHETDSPSPVGNVRRYSMSMAVPTRAEGPYHPAQ